MTAHPYRSPAPALPAVTRRWRLRVEPWPLAIVVVIWGISARVLASLFAVAGVPWWAALVYLAAGLVMYGSEWVWVERVPAPGTESGGPR